MADHSRPFLMDQMARDPCRCLVSPFKKSPAQTNVTFSSQHALACLNIAEDTAGLDPERAKAVYDLAEEIISVLHALLAPVCKEYEIEQTQ